jgi:alanine racemase
MADSGATATLTVRLDALAENYRAMCARAAPAAVAPVVKADAYGLGAARVAGALAAEGADTFFVARAEEGIGLRAILSAARIFVLDGVAPGTAPALLAHRLTPVLNALDEIAEWERAARNAGTRLEAALQIDTGMNRSGLAYSEIAQLAERIRSALSHIDPVLVLSHLACADQPGDPINRIQRDRFRAALAALPPARASLAASAGVALGPDYLFDLVRPGIALYGGNPHPGRANPWKTVAALTGRVLQIRHLEPGEAVGYGASFIARRPTALAIVGLGYGDGLIRASAGTGRAVIAGRSVPFAGRISMDLLALDATGIPDGDFAPGAKAEFFGDTISLEQAAAAAGTINYEVLTAISPRVPRVYQKG